MAYMTYMTHWGSYSASGVTCLACFLLVLGCEFVSADDAVNAQMGIIGPLGDGGSCGYAFDNTTQKASGAYQAAIPSTSPLVANLPANGCGACLSVDCNLVGNQGACKQGAGPLLLLIADSCPSCYLNAPLDGFNQIADTFLGNINVHARQVPCPAAGNIVARVKEYRPSGGGYIKLVFLNAASSGAFYTVQLRSNGDSGTGWLTMTNYYGATWEASSLRDFPLDLQITDSYNQTLTILKALQKDPSGDIDLGANFPLASVVGSPGVGPVGAGTFTSGAGSSRDPASGGSASAAGPAPQVPPVYPRPSHLSRLGLIGTLKKGSKPEGSNPESVLKRRSRSLLQYVYIPVQGTISLTDLINQIFGLPLATAPPSPPPSTSSSIAAQAPGNVLINPYPPPSVIRPPPPSQATSRPQVTTVASPPPMVLSPRPPAPVSPPPPALSSPPPPSPTSTPARTTPLPSPATAVQPPVSAPTGSGDLQLSSLPSPSDPCKKINDFLSESPSLQTWYKLLQSSGYTNSLGQPNVTITMFAPIDSAFSAPVLQNTVVGNSRGVSNISALAASDPASVNPLIGYHLLYGVTKASQLSSGMTFNTTDTIKTFGADDRTLSISIPASNQIQGIGSTATILRSDLQVCGPSNVFVIDTVLLPFSPNSAPSPAATTG